MNDRPMTPEEFRAFREGLGLSISRCARVLGCNPRTVQRFEAGDHGIAPRTAMLARRLFADAERAAREAAAVARERAADQGGAPAVVALLAYRRDEDLAEADREALERWRAVEVHRSVLNRAARLIEADGGRAAVVTFDPLDYRRWCAAEPRFASVPERARRLAYAAARAGARTE